MRFCQNCGEVISENVVICKKCGADTHNVNAQSQSDDSDKAVVYASQKATEVPELKTEVPSSKYIFWAIISIVILFVLKMNFMSIDISYSHTKYTGYKFLECFKGTARLSGMMATVIIIASSINILISTLALIKVKLKISLLKTISMLTTLSTILASIGMYFHINYLLQDFNSSKWSEGTVESGCYLNIAISIIETIVYFSCLLPSFKKITKSA